MSDDGRPDPKKTVSNVTPVKRQRRQSKVSRSRTTPAAITIAKRRGQALNLRLAGATYQAIADAIAAEHNLPSYDRALAYKDVKTALDGIIDEPAREVLAVALKRIEFAIMAIWPKVSKGELGASDRLVRLLERQSRYLGLDSPIRHSLAGPDGGPIEMAMEIRDPGELHAASLKRLDEYIDDRIDRKPPPKIIEHDES